MVINRWWEDQPEESFWLEITEREDLGADLHAPQTNESGKDYWSYSLVCEVQDGDVVFHYSKRDRTISLWSRADGGWWEDEIFGVRAARSAALTTPTTAPAGCTASTARSPRPPR